MNEKPDDLGIDDEIFYTTDYTKPLEEQPWYKKEHEKPVS